MPASSSTSSSNPAFERASNGRLRDLLGTLVLLLVFVTGDFLLRQSTYVAQTNRQPLRVLSYDISPEHIPGVTSQGQLVANAQGLRGELLAADALNVVLIGGSTTYCQLLGEDKTLSARLAQALRRQSGAMAGRLRVASLARGGQMVHTSARLLAALSEQPELKPKLVLGMIGVNSMIDFYLHASWPRSMTATSPDAFIPSESPFAPHNQEATHRRYNDPSSNGEWVHALRAHYAQHRQLSELSAQHRQELERKLATYQKRLRQLIQLVHSFEGRLVLATQPMNYHPDSPALSRTWALYINPGPREGFVPSPALMFRLLSRFNEVTRSVAEQQKVPLVDLAADMNGCAGCFYDQWHFTEWGAERAAHLLAPTVGNSLGLL